MGSFEACRSVRRVGRSSFRKEYNDEAVEELDTDLEGKGAAELLDPRGLGPAARGRGRLGRPLLVLLELDEPDIYAILEFDIVDS